MREKYYLEFISEIVNQVYEIQAKSWNEAKEKAFFQMEPGVRLVYGPSEMVKEYPAWSGYYYIDDQKAVRIATLEKGAWLDDGKGREYWDEDVFYWSDDPEYLFFADGSEVAE